jgi:hypothetical protein
MKKSLKILLHTAISDQQKVTFWTAQKYFEELRQPQTMM